MKIQKIILLVISIILTAILTECKRNKKSDTLSKQELVIYCENGILAPVREFSAQFEKETGIKVNIQNDCARNLSNLIYYRGEADIYIPDCRLSIDNMLMTNPEIIEDSAVIGYQTLIFIISPSNPINFDGQMATLTSGKFGIELANPETSSLGQATEKLLKHHSIYNEIIKSVLSLTTDSRGLFRNIASGNSQLAIDWESDYLSNSNDFQIIDTVKIPSNKIYYQAIAVVLKDAPNKENAMKFINQLKTPSGKFFFEKYGITDIPLSPN